MILSSRSRNSSRWAISGCSRSVCSSSATGLFSLGDARGAVVPGGGRGSWGRGRLSGAVRGDLVGRRFAGAGADLRLDAALVLLDGAQHFLVVELAADVVEAELLVHLLVGAAQGALDAADPQPREAHGFRQALGADHHQGDHGDQQQFREADIKHGGKAMGPWGRRLESPGRYCRVSDFSAWLAPSAVVFSWLSLALSLSSSLVSPSLTALRKLLMAPPRSPPRPLRRLVPKIRMTIARMIRSCQMLIPPKPMSLSSYDDVRLAFSSRPEILKRRCSSASTLEASSPRWESITRLWNHRSAVSPISALVSPLSAASRAARMVSTASSPTFSRILLSPLACRLAT